MTKPSTANILGILAILAGILFVIIKGVMPLVQPNGGRPSSADVQIIERLARLEEGTRKLESIPEKVAALTEATSGLKASVDRLERKIDDHVGRSPGK